MSYKIAVLIGSLRKDSYNRRLALALAALAPEEFVFEHLDIGQLPLYNQDDDDHQADAVVALKAAVEAADGLLFVTPEYNRSIPGVLKNALDQASRPWGKSSWQGKAAGVIGTSPSGVGTAIAQQHLRGVLVGQQVSVYAGPEVFLQFKDGLIDDKGHIDNEGTRKFLQGWVDGYVAWIKKLEA
ncbi:chromate reductase [Comamonas sp. BIGb0124]|uniref:NADPH-dependent FMN reductase n=1 Tax=Comamonas sp. BIGb0124 TaxID=2485130 RepID=UPI000F4A6DD1|nr:NAD(P)H-dependent oxidoreductase [Comamonas sp. BIGb0124]ROR21563.1 chromate reductase [Comamonas sp. BIGb0124]